jgi:hypothetical protein
MICPVELAREMSAALFAWPEALFPFSTSRVRRQSLRPGIFGDDDMRADRAFQRCGGITEEFFVHEDFGAVGIGSDEDGSGTFRWWS